jgi:mono/diheme cytochrome c family protein
LRPVTLLNCSLLAYLLTACTAAGEHVQTTVSADASTLDAAPPVPEWSDDDCATAVPDLRTPDGAALAEEIGRRFVASQSFRRTSLERSLTNKENGYAALRLAQYAVEGGWDDLPELAVNTRRLRVNAEGTLTRDDVVPRLRIAKPSLADGLQLGEWAFFNLASQDNPELAAVVLDPARVRFARASYGLWQDAAGALGGLVEAQYNDGSTNVSLTCATCHAVPDAEGTLLVGAPSLILLSDQSGVPWGESLVDVTGDDINNPVTIADLRATRFQQRLHWTGNLQNSLAALAVRVDTLLITARPGVRVPRDVVFGLAVYIWQLGERLSDASLSDVTAPANPTIEQGRALFQTHCVACHSGAWGAGGWVPAVNVGTDPAAADSPDRGTGGYRVPALLGFLDRRWTHEARSHDAWLSAEAALAHPPGAVLTTEDASALRAYVSRMGELAP